jgi:flagellin-like hook-associated protein FlgL
MALSPGLIIEMGKVYRGYARTFERLSTGLRLYDAANDASGLAIRAQLVAQVRSVSQALRNVGDGISLLQTAGLGLDTVLAAVQGIRALASFAANDGSPEESRANLHEELQGNLRSLAHAAHTTSWNGIALINGNLAPVARATPSVKQTQPLAEAETLTLRCPLLSGDAAQDRQVPLKEGMTQAQVVDAINASVVGHFVVASAVNGALTLTARAVDALSTFSVVSDKPATTDQTGIGTGLTVTQVRSPLAAGVTARVVAPVAQTTALATNELLTFQGPLFRSLPAEDQSVTLAAGMTHSAVLSAINDACVGHFVEASTAQEGQLMLTAHETGTVGSFQVVSDQDARADQTGVGRAELVGLGQDSLARMARVQAVARQTAPLAQSETLTLSGPLFGTLVVELPEGASQDEVADLINASPAGAYVCASVEDGFLTLTATTQGTLGSFAVRSNQPPTAAQSGIPTTALMAVALDRPDRAHTSATVTAQLAQTTPLSVSETLTFDALLLLGLQRRDKQVNLDPGDSQAAVIRMINESVIGQFITASSVAGHLTFTSNAAGIEGTFFVSSDQGAAASQSGLGTATRVGVGTQVVPVGPVELRVGAPGMPDDRVRIDLPGVTVVDLGLEDVSLTTRETSSSCQDRTDVALEHVQSAKRHVDTFLERLHSLSTHLTGVRHAQRRGRHNVDTLADAESLSKAAAQLIVQNARAAIQAQASQTERIMIVLLQQTLMKKGN